MSEPNSPNHWDNLTSLLGVQPQSEEQKVPPAQTPVSPAVSPAANKPVAQRSRRAAPKVASWDALANELGVTPAPEPPPVPKATAVSARTKPEVSEVVARPAAPSRSERLPEDRGGSFGRREAAAGEVSERPVRRPAEESPNFFDERFDFDEPFDFLESGDAEASRASKGGGESAEVIETEREAGGREPADEEEKRPHRRRRRRRRGKRDSEGRESREPSEPVSEGRSGETDRHDEEIAEEEVAEIVESEQEFDVGELIEAEGEDAAKPRRERDEEGERRSKRRRPRRKKKSRSSEGENAAVEGEARQERPAAESSRAETLEEERERPQAEAKDAKRSGEVADEEAEEEGDEEEVSARAGFRGIPTWDEAVGMIVAKNLESRAKRPGGGSGAPRSRGGQRGGGHRGSGQRGGGQRGGGRSDGHRKS